MSAHPALSAPRQREPPAAGAHPSPAEERSPGASPPEHAALASSVARLNAVLAGGTSKPEFLSELHTTTKLLSSVDWPFVRRF